jgi:3-oxoacyl-[acyl-carrier protein] reductase
VDLGLTGKVAMVAGASRGLGYAVARGLAREGVHVSMSSRNEASINDARAKITSETPASQALAVAVDVRSAESLTAWHARTIETFGGVDLLFVNAGGPPAGAALSFDDAAWQGAFELLVLSAVRMVRLAVPSMKSRGGGAIVVSTSSAVKEPIANLALSNVVRSSVAALSKTLANELAGDGIRVNHLLPGRIDTDRVRELDTIRGKASQSSPEQVRAAFEHAIPLGRYGHPDEYGSAAVFLFSDAARYITGASLQVDGGAIRGVY